MLVALGALLLPGVPSGGLTTVLATLVVAPLVPQAILRKVQVLFRMLPRLEKLARKCDRVLVKAPYLGKRLSVERLVVAYFIVTLLSLALVSSGLAIIYFAQV